MSISNFSFTGVESACIFASVTHEVESLEDLINDPDVSKKDKKEMKSALQVCKSVISKLESEENTTYSFVE